MKKIDIPTAPMILAVIVGGTMEQSFRQALRISDGALNIFYESTLALSLIIITLVLVVYPLLRSAKIFRRKAN
ncbi:MAG: hypothetical protein LR001_09975 [Clostridiales bacterium]|nr:hypothetical protein [Clostridiales bacterium]